MKRFVWAALALLTMTLCAARQARAQGGAVLTRITTREAALDREDVREAIESGVVPPALAGEVFRYEYMLPIGGGTSLRVIEEFTVGALLAHPRRLVFCGAPPLGNALAVAIDVEGYDFLKMLAQANYIAVAVDPPGTGASTPRPADGDTITVQAVADAYRRAIRRLRAFHGVHLVDYYGEGGVGGEAGLLLAREADLLRTYATSGLLYLRPTPAMTAPGGLLSPQFRGFLDSLPTGYISTVSFPGGPDFYALVKVGTTAEVAQWIDQTQPDSYGDGTAYDALNTLGQSPPVPVVTANQAAVPGWLVNDLNDAASASDDLATFAANYGPAGAGLATTAVIGDGLHVPRIAAATHLALEAGYRGFLAAH